MSLSERDARRLGARPARTRKAQAGPGADAERAVRRDRPATHTSAAFVIPGDPVPWARAQKQGKRHFTADAQRRAMGDIVFAWQCAGAPWLGRVPVALELDFFRARPPSHYGTGRNTGRVKPSAPAFPVGTPDTSNLLKLVEDALNERLFWDDGQVVDVACRLRWAEPEAARTDLRVMAICDS